MGLKGPNPKGGEQQTSKTKMHNDRAEIVKELLQLAQSLFSNGIYTIGSVCTLELFASFSLNDVTKWERT